MLNSLREIVTYGIPWWVWSIPSIGGAIGVFVLVSRTIGWRNAIPVTLGFIMLTVAILSRSRGRQEGWADRIKKENRDAQNLVDRANAARTRARKLNSTPERLYADDGFKR